eukprot:CAMPEP_0204630362 /NCGR_PEP_ID=MMETSP0717-20131115/20243_1 /ASSEMBLY_ACC=CAM_ASM_000666 /TAXON_ID=230516 /ORGANISM="Chaetoceros curvisetus" /LENGTH=72 /DNA_ID=CAMNT_0051647575 /DNA_START=158 /DNA_END=372 /DNA_ORIENTATION=+
MTNIHQCTPDEELRTIGTGRGSEVYRMKGFDTLLHLPVHYNEKGMANILSLATVADNYRVSMDTSNTHSFFV